MAAARRVIGKERVNGGVIVMNCGDALAGAPLWPTYTHTTATSTAVRKHSAGWGALRAGGGRLGL